MPKYKKYSNVKTNKHFYTRRHTPFPPKRRTMATTKRDSRVKPTPPLLAAAAMAAVTFATFAMHVSAARTPSVPSVLTTTSTTSSTSGRSLLGSGRLGGQPAAAPPPPPPPRRLTPREMLANSLVSFLQSLLTAQGEAERDGAGVGALGGNGTGFNATSASTPFVGKLIQEARAASRPSDASTPFVGNGDIIPVEVQERLCDGEFLRGGDGARVYSATEADVAYAAAYPLHREGAIPVVGGEHRAGGGGAVGRLLLMCSSLCFFCSRFVRWFVCLKDS